MTPLTPAARARTALVTGAGSGIGAAVARQLSSDGYRVALLARRRAPLEAVAAELPGPSMVVPADVTDAQQLDSAFSRVESRWSAVDVLVVAAGAGHAAPVVETSDDDWQRMLDLNLTAPFRCLRRALPPMLDQGWGRVVVVASVTAKRGEAQVAAYSASKHGVLGLVRSAAAEVARSGVTVNAVCPGYVDTPMTDGTVAAIVERTGNSTGDARSALARRQPVGRLIAPDEVAAAVSMLVANGAITGQGVNVDGGAVQS